MRWSGLMLLIEKPLRVGISMRRRWRQCTEVPLSDRLERSYFASVHGMTDRSTDLGLFLRHL